MQDVVGKGYFKIISLVHSSKNKKYTITGGIVLGGVSIIVLSLLWSFSITNSGLDTSLSSNNNSQKIASHESLIEDFQGGHGFYKQVAGGGLQEDDHVNYVLGKQSLKLATEGDGSAIFTRKSNISPPIDFDNKFLRVWLKVSDTPNIRELRITVTGDRFETLRNYWLYRSDKISVPLEDNKWTVVTVGLDNIEDIGSADLSRIDTIQLRVSDNGMGSTIVWINGLEIIEGDKEN